MQIVTANDTEMEVNADLEPSATSIRRALQFIALLRRRKTIVIASVAVALLLGGFHYATAKRVYQAKAALLVQSTGSDPMTAATSFSGVSRDMHTFAELFTTDIVLSQAAKNIEHWPPGINGNIDSSDAPAALRSLISAENRKGTSIIDIGCKSEDPKAAVSVLNAVVDSYLSFMDKNHKNVAIEIVHTLDQERESVRTQIEQKGRELIIAKKTSGDLSVGESGNANHPLVERVMRLNASLFEAQQKRVTLQVAWAGVENELRSGGDISQYLIDLEPTLGEGYLPNLLGISVEEKSAIEKQLFSDKNELQSLRQHYGRAHSKVRELEERIRHAHEYLVRIGATFNGRVVQSGDRQHGSLVLNRIAKAMVIAQQREAAMRGEYLRIKAEAIGLNERLANVQIVQRDLERLRNLHETILTRIANIDINQEHSSVRASIVRRPTVPTRPISPKLAKIIALCLVAGFVIGAAIVFVLDLLDDRFGSPEEISDQLRAPVLAMIRDLPQRDAVGADAIHIHADQDDLGNEAFRTLRTALTFSGHECERLAITSSEPGDGKTTVMANLGASYAQAGKRTLLVDADLRNPGLTKMFDLRRRGGLSSILRSADEVSTVCQQHIVSSGVDNLDMLPCGPRPTNPSELLSGPRLEEFIAWAETTYDQVLFDCPPVLAASDAALVGKRTDGMLLVVQPEKNHRRLVMRAAEELRSLQVSLIGLVANRLSDHSDPAYGYGYGYGYGEDYGYGAYGANDEPSEEQSTTPRQVPVRRAS
jgi:capsular exopolysaccharide synthesis family protein